MKTKLVTRLIFAVSLALIMMLVVTVVQAQQAATPTPKPTECHECHESIVSHWEEGAHGQASSSSSFIEAWQEDGQPGECMQCHTTGYEEATGMWEEDGVACATCHWLGENSPSHPDMVMLTDNSSRACGECHIDTHSEWQESVHGQGELTCIRCHNPHTTGLKSDNVQSLCANCHPAQGSLYNHTGHAADGLLCTDCHLQVSDSPPGEGHGTRQHTFFVDLKTCNNCHSAEMHAPATEAMTATIGIDNGAPAGLVGTGDSFGTTMLSTNPQPANPFGMLLAAGLGLGLGFFIAPAADRWYRRFVAA